MRNRTVLVIEHDPLNTNLLRALLTLGGYLTVDAGKAEDGMRLARERAPDCVIIDVRLPEMDGLRAIQVFKEDPGLRTLPVIAVTADTTDLRQEAIQAGCDAYITRPIASSSFLETIGRLVAPRPHMRRQGPRACSWRTTSRWSSRHLRWACATRATM